MIEFNKWQFGKNKRVGFWIFEKSKINQDLYVGFVYITSHKEVVFAEDISHSAKPEQLIDEDPKLTQEQLQSMITSLFKEYT